MDSLFGIELTSILIALLVMVGAIFGVLAFIAWRNPLLVRMGVRNITRRKAQTVLIIIGLMLSTLIISAAFATGDTVGYSVTNTIYNDFGSADVVAGFDEDLDAAEGRDGVLQSDVDALRAGFEGDPDVDAITGIVQTPVPALNPGERLSEPNALLVGVDAASTDAFEQLLTADGDLVLASDLAPGEVYASQKLADDIRLEVGSSLTIYVEAQPYEFTVRDIVRDNALTASTALTGGGQAAGGVVTHIERVREILGEPERVDLVVISAAGGVRGTLDLVDGIDERLDAIALAQGLPVGSFATKVEAVELAELVGSLFVTFFLVFGLFSMAAGIMLIFLTFVMLAAERRSEMGMARAIGMKRLHLTESFIAEGMSYNLGSALVGAILGLGVAWALIAAMGQVLDDFGLNIAFHVNATGFLIAYCLGVVITFVTVAFSSWRSANLNIVRAIRDIPEPEPLRGRDTSLGGLAKATVGAAWYVQWVGVVSLGVLLLVAAFISGLAFYGIPVVIAALVIAFYVWGA
ncbi:MAG: FtsX-like permease family protein, partial [Dehalococcoidia bacterium]